MARTLRPYQSRTVDQACEPKPRRRLFPSSLTRDELQRRILEQDAKDQLLNPELGLEDWR